MTELPKSLFTNQPDPIVENAVDRVIDDCARQGQQPVIRLTVVADSSKFERRAAFKVCDLEEIDNLVGDKFPGPALNDALIKNKVGIL